MSIPGVSKIVDPDRLRKLLDAAILLMSQYAGELNKIDGKNRQQYSSIEHWSRDASTK